MRYISLKNTSLTYFNSAGTCSELSGSSQYIVEENQIICKRKETRNKIENTTAKTDYLQSIVSLDNEHQVIKRLKEVFNTTLETCITASFNEIDELHHLDKLNEILKQIRFAGEKDFINLQLSKSEHEDKNSIYYREKVERKEDKQINKTKVKGKMYALFNLKCSRKFMAFYSISFPENTTDNQAFICWNYWLTQLRKRFNLENYIWVTEKQKNGTIHFHMLTNNYMPILSINRIMAIIINNQVLKDLQSWGNSSLDKFNGVDVDSIYNSKRHKKSGKTLNPSELRNWISKYVTKYVTKNSEKFTHLCWHCSRSISILFTSTILHLSESQTITNFLPTLRHLYKHIKSDFNDVWIFCFVPPEHLFDKIKYFNDLIFEDFEPKKLSKTLKINLKTKTL